jgi:drug/metabolite transporter (DMT)-like permease
LGAVIFDGTLPWLPPPQPSCLPFCTAVSGRCFLASSPGISALPWGGIARVTPVQLFQSFVTLTFAALLLGEHVTAETIVFMLAVVVVLGRVARVALISQQEKGPENRPFHNNS